MMERVRYLVPVAQVLVHADQEVQPDCLQSMGQPKVLQVVVEVSPTQPRPPKAAGVRTERVLVLEPVPQDLVQAP